MTVTALRSLLRFLHVDGLVTRPLTTAVPSVAGWRLAGIPKALQPAQVRALLAACDRRTRTGRRAFAVMTLLIRLGLRAGEVAARRLDDIDWRAGTVVIRGKGSQVESLPWPADVGEAVVAYLRRGRPATSHRSDGVCAREGAAPRPQQLRPDGDRRGGGAARRSRRHPCAPLAPYHGHSAPSGRRPAPGNRAAASPSPRADDRDLCQGGSRCPSCDCPPVARRCGMTPAPSRAGGLSRRAPGARLQARQTGSAARSVSCLCRAAGCGASPSGDDTGMGPTPRRCGSELGVLPPIGRSDLRRTYARDRCRE